MLATVKGISWIRREDCIETLYDVFSTYPRFVGYVGCTHCVSEEEQDRLRPVLLRELGVVLLRPVAYNAGVGTFGDVSDYKHFLPRLCELLLTEEGRSAYVESVVFAGLRLYSFATWTREEQEAVLCYLQAWLAESIEAQDMLHIEPSLWMLQDMAKIFPSQEHMRAAVWGLPDALFAKTLAQLGWGRSSLAEELWRLWESLMTAESYRRVAPILASLPDGDDFFILLSELLGCLPAG